MLFSSLFFLLCLPVALPPSIHVDALPSSKGYYINCGSTEEETTGNVAWLPDSAFIRVGAASKISTPGIIPVLSTLRHFPDKSARKYCYVIPVNRGTKYLIRATYYYGGFDGGNAPPVFDQIIDGTRWSTVDTAKSYASGLTSYYEIVVAAKGKTLSFCLARNDETVSDPFISALELVSLEDSMYNSTDFTKYALITIARHSFGHNGGIISYPDDPFNRNWEPFMDANPAVQCQSNVSSSEFWNIPPEKALQTGLTTSRGKALVVQWPPLVLPTAIYYVALYFQDNRTPSPYSWRVFDVSVNGKNFFKGLNASTDGVMVYGTQWQLSGKTEIMLTPHENATVGPIINAGEMMQLVPFDQRTPTRDVIAMEDLARSLKDPPPDWTGDPCLPRQHSWTGVVCSGVDTVRVVGVNLTNYGIAGSLPDSISNLSALTSLWLSGNKLSGPIPDMSQLKNLISVHLQDNELTGTIPSTLGALENLKELYLQNNKLTGQIPDSLKRIGLNLQVAAGNQIS